MAVQTNRSLNSSGDEGNNCYSNSNDDDKFPPDAEIILQKEMMKLSLKDRNRLQEEIHGVHCAAKEESPELLRESLRNLDLELNSNQVPPEERKNYLKSQTLFADRNLPTYVNTEAFRLRFLRSTLFDVSAAAIQINKYLGMMDELFGEFALQRPIRISDFDKTELREMRKGRFQYLPYRDRAGKRGRRVLVVFPDKEWENQSTALRAKIRLYMMYVAGEDVEAQKNGIVVLVWFDNAWKNVSKLPHNRPLLALGCRISSVHVCTPDTPVYRFRRSLLIRRVSNSNQYERSRIKFHVGQSMELMYRLQSFGIPVDYIPVSFTGNIKDKYLKEWIRLRQLIEDERVTRGWTSESKSSMIESPYLDDIVFRNGTSLLSHPGNSSLRTIIALEIMNHKTKNTKELVAEVISEIKGRKQANKLVDTVSSSRRFLIWDERGWWKEVPPEKEEEELYSKISRIVRDSRKILLANHKTAHYEAKGAERGRRAYMFVDSNSKRQRMSSERDCFGSSNCDSRGFCNEGSK